MAVEAFILKDAKEEPLMCFLVEDRMVHDKIRPPTQLTKLTCDTMKFLLTMNVFDLSVRFPENVLEKKKAIGPKHGSSPFWYPSYKRGTVSISVTFVANVNYAEILDLQLAGGFNQTLE